MKKLRFVTVNSKKFGHLRLLLEDVGKQVPNCGGVGTVKLRILKLTIPTAEVFTVTCFRTLLYLFCEAGGRRTDQEIQRSVQKLDIFFYRIYKGIINSPVQCFVSSSFLRDC